MMFVRSLLAVAVVAASITGAGVAAAKQAPRAFNGEKCTIVGTAKADVLRGTKGDDVICGLVGNDRIIGLAGDDIIDGGAGLDILNGGAGDDLCDYQAGEKRVATCRYDDSPPQMDVTITPGVIDATRAGGEARVTLTFDDEWGLAGGSLDCARMEPPGPHGAYPIRRETVINWGFEVGIPGSTAPDDAGFILWQTSQELPDDRISWTLRDSTLTFDLHLPIGKAVEPGTIACTISAVDRLGHRGYLQKDNAFEVVVGPAAGQPAPDIVSVDFTPSVIDMGKRSRTATVTVVVNAPAGLKDMTTMCGVNRGPVGSGSDAFMLTYWSGRGGLPYANSGSGHGPHTADFALSRDGSTSTLRHTWPMRATLANGSYDCMVTVTDDDGVESQLWIPQAVTLMGGDERDIEGPRLEALTVNPGVVDVGRSGEDVTIDVAATDASGVQHVVVTCGNDRALSASFSQSEIDPTTWRVVTGAPGRNRSEQVLTGVKSLRPNLSAVLTVPFGYTPGVYPCSVQMSDVLGSSSSVQSTAFLTVERTGTIRIR